MDELFEQFARGEMPNVIELMEAISKISEMWPAPPCLDCRAYPDTQECVPHAPESIFRGKCVSQGG